MKFEYGSINFEELKSFERRRENTRVYFSDKPVLLIVNLNRFVCLFYSLQWFVTNIFCCWKIRKDKQRTENDRKRMARKQQEYNDIDWEDLYHKNQLSTLRVGELELYINHHNILFKGKKDEKVRVVKAHIGSKILTAIVQEKQTNIPLASESNPEFDSDSDSDRVEGIVGSSSNSSELNDSGDQAAGRQQLEQETIPESSTSRYRRKRTRVLRENYVPWNNIHVETH